MFALRYLRVPGCGLDPFRETATLRKIPGGTSL